MDAANAKRTFELFNDLDEAARAAYVKFLFDNNLVLRHHLKGLEPPKDFTGAVRLIKTALPAVAIDAWLHIARNETRPHILWDRSYDTSVPIILSPGALDMVLKMLSEKSEDEQHSRWQLEAAELYDSLKGN